MRKSQAPSFKRKLLSLSSPGLKISSIPDPLNPDKAVRSTERVLDLILNSDNLCNVVETENENPRNDYNTSESPITKDTSIKTSIDNCVKSPPETSLDKSLITYNVVYGKQSKKKHKTWEGDGTLEVGSKCLTLKDENGKVIGTVAHSKGRQLEEGARLYVGSKEVELIELVDVKSAAGPNETKNDNLSLIKPPQPKVKSNLSKRYQSPKLNYSSGLILPEPNAQHQWHFNQNNLPITPVYIESSLAKKLRKHQVEGVAFLYKCIMGFNDAKLTGAILADEMGLGKTLQCITLIWTLLKQGIYGSKPVLKKVLIVTPSSLVMNWYNEFIKWLGRVKLVPFVVNQKSKATDFRGPVMIISYEMLLRSFEDVEKHDFDLLICDEGHRLKNTNIRTTQMLQNLSCLRRILLTGTPIQNDLQEFYALVHFVNPNVLGTLSEFHRRYEQPILASRQPKANEWVLAKGKECSQDLKRITREFLLRRTKDILNDYLPPRHEVVVFCNITEPQRKLYNSLIESFLEGKENLLGCSIGPLELITSLKKISSHPSLLRKDEKSTAVPEIELSSKLMITVNLLKELRENSPKEKVVFVSSSTQTLDLVGKILTSMGCSSCRLDGSTPAAQRNDIVDKFNLNYSNSFVFLLSAKAGGVGLNLTGASRLILFDSDWNPATDLQAIGRIWRDGQKYPVFIYRLITTGTIEEKIYQRQISKQGLCEGTVDPENAKSIKFSDEELKDIFSYCTLKEDCLTHEMLSCECSRQGEIPGPETEEEERSCQLMKESNSSLKISELMSWEHHGRPFDCDFLTKLCLRKSEESISFIFHNCKN